jgi:DNA segregation ATPase FtsK/SpoIIIE-like protein
VTPEPENALYSAHPRLLVHWPGQGLHMPMHFGVQCGDGWWHLVDRLLHRAQVHADERGFQPVVLQIKEKLGALRVYWRDADEVIRGMTRFAEDLSASICEVCGLPGALVTNRCGGRRTRCESHQHITDPDTPDGPQEPEQRPRTRHRERRASCVPLADPPDQVLIDAALLLANEVGTLSIAMLQRRLKIGHARAERLRDAVLAIVANSSSNPSPRRES